MMDAANINAYDGVINFYTSGGTVSIGNSSGTSTVITGTSSQKGSLMFYTTSGKTLLNCTVSATIEGRANVPRRETAFYYTGS